VRRDPREPSAVATDASDPVCSKCGAAVNSDDQFCGACGHELLQPTETDSAENEEARRAIEAGQQNLMAAIAMGGLFAGVLLLAWAVG